MKRFPVPRHFYHGSSANGQCVKEPQSCTLQDDYFMISGSRWHVKLMATLFPQKGVKCLRCIASCIVKGTGALGSFGWLLARLRDQVEGEETHSPALTVSLC